MADNVRLAIAGMVVAMFSVVAPAEAQVATTGAISGRVVDADGVPLPGAQVAISSAALIGGERTSHTGPTGSYRIDLLPSGEYRVVVRLTGFTIVEQDRLEVGVRRTTSYNAVLKLSSIEETVTVMRSSPLIDVRSTKRSSEFSDEVRNALPEYRGVGGDMLNLSPDASTNNTGNPTSSTPSFLGSPPNATTYQIDGATVSDPSNGGQFPFYSPDWFETVQITTTGGGPEFSKAMGSVFNVVTKSGGNEFHGETNFFFRNDALTSDNTANIESSLVDFTPEQLDHHYDFSLNVGGPVIRDRLWFFAGYQANYRKFRNAGAFLDGSEDSDRFFGKLTWQPNVDNRIITSVMANTTTFDGPSSPFVTPEAGYLTPSFTLTPNITWNYIVDDSTFFEVKYSGFYGYFAREPVSDGPMIIDFPSGIRSGGASVFTADRARTDVQANVSHFAEDLAGQHSFRMGGEYERLTSDEPFTWSAHENHFFYYTYFGQPYLAYAYEPFVDRATSDVRAASLYVQDDWTVGNRATLNLGIRYDHWDIGFVDAQRPDEPTFNDLSPRLGVNFDVLGDGRASLHAFCGRFYEEPHGEIFSVVDPNRAVAVGLFWDDGEWVEWLRSDPLEDARIDPDLTNVYSDQFSAGFDYELRDNLSIGTRYVHKRDANIIGSENVGNDYVPISVTSDDGVEMTIFAADPGYTPSWVVVNNPSSRFPSVGEAFREYDGLQIRVNRRFADNWMAMGSLMVQKATGNIRNTSTGNLGGGFSHQRFDSPNDFVNTPGELPNSRRYVFKLQGTWMIPDPLGISVGAQFDASSSARWSVTERFSSSITNRVPSGDRTVPIRPIGSETLEPLVNLDLRLEKRFSLQGGWGRVDAIVDIFNVFNADTVRRIRERVPLFGEPTAIVRARRFRLGLRWLF